MTQGRVSQGISATMEGTDHEMEHPSAACPVCRKGIVYLLDKEMGPEMVLDGARCAE